jgi:hypothetical protein
MVQQRTSQLRPPQAKALKGEGVVVVQPQNWGKMHWPTPKTQTFSL